MKLKLQHLSDIHEEFSHIDISELIHDEANLVIFTGDISTGYDMMEALSRTANQFPDKTFVAIAGNHELYTLSYDDYLQNIHGWNQLCDNLHFIENSSVELFDGKVCVAGGIGWSNLKGFDEESKQNLSTAIDDFKLIHYRDRLLKPSDLPILNLEYQQSMVNHFNQSEAGIKIGLSHFPQSHQLANSKFDIEGLGYYFCSDSNDFFIELAELNVALFLSGHTHESYDKSVEGVRNMSIQVGYPEELFSEQKDIIIAVKKISCEFDI
ncbi:metallophosphoesterase [Vibrio sp. SS-MA-C1-2]|uniref:metallophosphoesterase family protein n=1 Tax=Vibrio sp. SS-MA-C1-2 TaxID=2908646 RepID=UPI001F158657|nr:metallophosphoesterase [Vibrio sp. SS-MA-C1-2]UJF17786.1 metallophosphoesterase [Vibrio sp. SS-MA-C1-2]